MDFFLIFFLNMKGQLNDKYTLWESQVITRNNTIHHSSIVLNKTTNESIPILELFL